MPEGTGYRAEGHKPGRKRRLTPETYVKESLESLSGLPKRVSRKMAAGEPVTLEQVERVHQIKKRRREPRLREY